MKHLLGNYFNPLPRKEGDSPLMRGYIEQWISIHSLVKRETQKRCHLNHLCKISIHSLVKRETNRFPTSAITSFLNFNPLPRKEGDSANNRISSSVGDFNPLPRKEGDSLVAMEYAVLAISIHSLVKRET